MKLNRLLYTRYGKILMSIILGLGLATLFREKCNGKSCYKFVSPNLKEVSNNTYKFDNSCYKFKPVAKKCRNIKTVRFA